MATDGTQLDQSGLDAHFRTFFKTQHRDFRAANIARLVHSKLRDNGSILDIGCGSCVVTRFLLERGFTVTAADTSSEMVDMAREFLAESGHAEMPIHHTDIAGCVEKFGATFDQLVCLDVIEHIADDGAAVGDLFQLLKPGGRLVLSVPAMPSLYGPKDEQVGHYRRYTKDMLRTLFADHGFKLRSLRYWNALGVPITWVSLKVLRRAVSEAARQSNRSPVGELINTALRTWFRVIENPIPFPRGMTLLAVADRPSES